MVERLAISVGEFAEALGISKPKAYQIIRGKDFKGAFKLGKRTLISVQEAKHWIETMAENYKDFSFEESDETNEEGDENS